eukprot:COSAG03_NODE_2070_length_3156_cov_7.928361_5_plen_242_part_00
MVEAGGCSLRLLLGMRLALLLWHCWWHCCDTVSSALHRHRQAETQTGRDTDRQSSINAGPSWHIACVGRGCLNDANGLFTYRGVNHVLFQSHHGNIGHVVSTDWVHWHWLKPAVPVDANGVPAPPKIVLCLSLCLSLRVSLSLCLCGSVFHISWWEQVSWDGSVTVGLAGGPIILFDSPPEPSHINLARPDDLTDPNLTNWSTLSAQYVLPLCLSVYLSLSLPLCLSLSLSLCVTRSGGHR